MLGMLACRWDRIHDRVGKPGIPLEGGKEKLHKEGPDEERVGAAVASYSLRLKLGKLFPVF